MTSRTSASKTKALSFDKQYVSGNGDHPAAPTNELKNGTLTSQLKSSKLTLHLPLFLYIIVKLVA